jgi:deoxyribonuclease I
MRQLIILVFSAVFFLSGAAAEPPPNPPSSFTSAKKIARNIIYANPDQRVTIYCGCPFKSASSASGGIIEKIGTNACKYRPRKNEARGRRLEWEHIVPASSLGDELSCWKDGDDACVTRKGKTFKGRKCCAKVSEEFKMMEADLHNLTPAVGEVNGDRSNHPHGNIANRDDVDFTYGKCPFVISKSFRDEDNGLTRIAEQSPEQGRDVRGDIARIWFYMNDAYGVDIPTEIWNQLVGWSQDDPVDDAELARDQRIFDAQGNHNPFVAGEEP